MEQNVAIEKNLPETFRVFTRSMAYELRTRGFRCLYTKPDFYNPRYDVYYFMKTPELMAAVNELAAAARAKKMARQNEVAPKTYEHAQVILPDETEE